MIGSGAGTFMGIGKELSWSGEELQPLHEERKMAIRIMVHPRSIFFILGTKIIIRSQHDFNEL